MENKIFINYYYEFYLLVLFHMSQYASIKKRDGMLLDSIFYSSIFYSNVKFETNLKKLLSSNKN